MEPLETKNHNNGLCLTSLQILKEFWNYEWVIYYLKQFGSFKKFSMSSLVVKTKNEKKWKTISCASVTIGGGDIEKVALGFGLER